MGFFNKKEKIDYEKLAKAILRESEGYKLQNEVFNEVRDYIIENIIKHTNVDDIVSRLRINYENHYGYKGSYSLDQGVANRVADKLVNDVYDLQKAEVLKNVHSEGVLNILHSKLEDQAKQHVLDFITKPVNNNGY